MDNENDLDPLGTEDEAELDMDDPLFEEDDAFFDDEGFGEEEFASEDWEEYEDESLGEGDDRPTKKKSKFNPLMIGGGVVAVLVVLYMMGGSGEQQPPPQPQATQPGAPQQAQSTPTNLDVIYGGQQDQEVAKTDMPAQVKGGLFHDEQALAEIEKVKDQFVFEEYVIDDDGNTEEGVSVVDNPPMPSPMNSKDVLTPLPDEETARNEFNESDFSFLGDEQTGEATTGDSPAVADTNEADPAQIPRPPSETADLSGSVDLSGITESLNLISERLSAIENDAVTKTDLAALQEKISDLESGFDDITRQLATGPVSSAVQRQDPVEAPSPKAQTATTQVKPQVKPPVPAVVQKPQEPASQWVLKAAQPGSALVSAKGGEEVIALRVGDNLPGIGEVQAITRENGLWTVVGSRGRILQ